VICKPSDQPLNEVSLPQGLEVSSAACAIETVSSKSGSFSLLVAAANIEVVEGTLNRHKRLILVPTEATHQITETYYILEGILEGQLTSGRLAVTPGQLITTTQLTETVILEAQTPVRFLYISPHPFFHEISQAIHELKTLAVEVELKDGYTADHCSRIQALSYATGEVLGLSATQLHRLSYGAYLHDVGKIKIPTEILTKPGKLTDAEYRVIQAHPSYGRMLLEPTSMHEAGVIVEQHHERLDGSGYPQALSRDTILVESYIVAVADTYDAMTTDRPYRKALSVADAFAELKRYSDIHYPKEVVSAFTAAIRQLGESA
jgi:HD-GYP domain-containing protein (c-di-GMP phosphodiesterase class II)